MSRYGKSGRLNLSAKRYKCGRNLPNRKLRKKKNSETPSKEDEKNNDQLPLEPLVQIKEEPLDYDPAPSTSTEENTSTPPIPATPDPVMKPQFILSLAGLATSEVPGNLVSEILRKKRKVHPSSNYVPSANSLECRPIIHAIPDPVVQPQYFLSFASVASSEVPGNSVSEIERQKQTIQPSATYVPSANSLEFRPIIQTTSDPVVEPEFTLSVASLASPEVPEHSYCETVKKKRKVQPSSTYVPSSNGLEFRPSSPVDHVDSSNTDSLNESVKDHFDIFGEYIAAKLRCFDPRSCAHAQKAISNIIFETETDKFKDGDPDCKPLSDSAS